MKDFKHIGKPICILLLSCLLLPACSDMNEYFETPDWIGGSIYQTLQDDGNYSIFLQGVDIANYQPIVNGKSILTVMAPDDNAMTQYLQDNYGTTDITQVDPDEVSKLIGFHILYYSFDKNKLINFRPEEGDGATEEEKNLNAGLYYKFRTRSQDALTTAYDATRRRNVQVYHNERLMPVFSYRMFQTKNIDAKENYEYFYPETGWQGDDGFNVVNAAVTEYEQIARNGYIYKVDRVLTPLETIYNELNNAGKYTRILDLYDRSEYYYYDGDATLEMAASDSLFKHYHYSPLVNIDSEWGDVTSYTEISTLSSQAFTIFAPTDQAFQDFFDEYWREGGYSSLDEIDSVTMLEIMQSCVISSSIVFPSEVEKGTVVNISGEVVGVNTDEVTQEDRIMCSNGVLYGCSVLTPPARFRAVTGPAYQYKDFSNFNEMLSNSGMASTLVTDAVRYAMLYPTNEQLYNNAGIQRVDGTLVSSTAPNGMSTSTQTAYINAHVVQPIDNDTQMPTTGTKVMPTLTADFKMYWYVKDGKITNSILHNGRLKYADNTTTDDQIWADFEPLGYRGDIDGWTNGHAYTYENILFPGDYSAVNNSSLVRLMTNTRFDTTTEFFGWINLLNKASLINISGGTLTSELTLESCFTFIPTTEALESAIVAGRVPGVNANGAAVGDASFFDIAEITDRDALIDYLKLYFIPLSSATFSNYPYLDWGENTTDYGGLTTLQQYVETQNGNQIIIATKMNIYDDGSSLYITIIDPDTGVEGQRVKVSGSYDYFPFIFEDGGAHFIEDVF